MSNDIPAGPPTPGSEHALLKPFEGTFRAAVSLWTGLGDSMVEHGTMVSSFQVGGLYLFQDYTGDPSSGPWPAFVGQGFWGYNTNARQYEGFWIDNASTMMQLERGTVDATGRIWTMLSSFLHPHTGQHVTKKSVIRLIDNDHNDMTSWMTRLDGNEVRTMHIDFVRS